MPGRRESVSLRPVTPDARGSRCASIVSACCTADSVCRRRRRGADRERRSTGQEEEGAGLPAATWDIGKLVRHPNDAASLRHSRGEKTRSIGGGTSRRGWLLFILRDQEDGHYYELTNSLRGRGASNPTNYNFAEREMSRIRCALAANANIPVAGRGDGGVLVPVRLQNPEDKKLIADIT